MNNTGTSPSKMKNISLHFTLLPQEKQHCVQWTSGFWSHGTVIQNTALTHLLDDLEGFHFLRDPEQERLCNRSRIKCKLLCHSGHIHQPLSFQYTSFTHLTDLSLSISYFLWYLKWCFYFNFWFVHYWYIGIQFIFSYYIILSNLAKLSHQLTTCHILKCYLAMCMFLYS